MDLRRELRAPEGTGTSARNQIGHHFDHFDRRRAKALDGGEGALFELDRLLAQTLPSSTKDEPNRILEEYLGDAGHIVNFLLQAIVSQVNRAAVSKPPQLFIHVPVLLRLLHMALTYKWFLF